MSEYPVNRGIGKPVEFKGLKSQYLFIFCGGLLAVFVVFIILFMAGVNQWLCIGFIVSASLLLVWQTFRLNARYGTHGLMKAAARKRHPRFIINRKALPRLFTYKSKYSINSLVYWVTYVHNVVYSFYRSMIYCYINSTQRCAGSIVIDIIPTNGADKRKFFPFAPYFPVTNVIKRYFYPYFPAIIGIKGYSFPYFPYLSGIMKIKTALYSLFSRLDWHKTVVFPCLGEIYEGIRSLSWEIPVT